MCEYFAGEFDMTTRTVRFHNIYGPYGTFDGGREKAPAAMCRKVALAEDGGSIEVWGDGEQTRSFCYIDDCVEGIYRLMQSDYAQAAEPRHRPHGDDQRAGRDRHGHRRQAGLASTTSTGRRACGVATPTTPGCARCSAGSRASSSRRGWPTPTDGSRSRWPGASPVTAPRLRDDHDPRVDVLGVQVSAIDIPTAVDEIGRWIEQREHALRVRHRRARRDGVAGRRRAAGASTTSRASPRPTACRWCGPASGPASPVQRVYGPDLMLRALRSARSSGLDVVLLRRRPTACPSSSRERLTARFPGLRVAGTYSPPFRPLTPEEDAEVVERINAAAPDLVWVGLSTPKQERWMAAHVGLPERARAARRRCRVRHPRGHAAAGPALDAAPGSSGCSGSPSSRAGCGGATSATTRGSSGDWLRAPAAPHHAGPRTESRRGAGMTDASPFEPSLVGAIWRDRVLVACVLVASFGSRSSTRSPVRCSTRPPPRCWWRTRATRGAATRRSATWPTRPRCCARRTWHVKRSGSTSSARLLSASMAYYFKHAAVSLSARDSNLIRVSLSTSTATAAKLGVDNVVQAYKSVLRTNAETKFEGTLGQIDAELARIDARSPP